MCRKDSRKQLRITAASSANWSEFGLDWSEYVESITLNSSQSFQSGVDGVQFMIQLNVWGYVQKSQRTTEKQVRITADNSRQLASNSKKLRTTANNCKLQTTLVDNNRTTAGN